MVATDWGPVIQTGIGAAAAIGGGVLGAWANGRNQERTERQQRRERAAEVLAEVASVLDDIEPPFPPDRPSPVDSQRLADATRRWGQVRMRLFVLGAVHPSPKVRELVESLQANVSLALDSVRLLVRFLRDTDPESEAEADVRRRLAERDEAERWYGAAHDSLREVVEAIQQPETTGWWAARVGSVVRRMNG